jgi:hypothetical protein
MSGTMTDKGIFFLVLFLALLLVLFIYAVIRVPPELADSQEQPVLDLPEPSPLAPTASAPQPLPVRRPRSLAPPVPAPAVPPPPVPAPAAAAFGGSGNGGYAARHATVAVPVITAPKVSGGPPWGPAPKPPGLE